jgi:hypothetical protein
MKYTEDQLIAFASYYKVFGHLHDSIEDDSFLMNAKMKEFKKYE